MKNKTLLTKPAGFSMVELLVVMAIAAVIIGLSLVSVGGARRAARDGKRKTDLEQIRSALEMCRADSGSYPAGTLVSGGAITCGSTTYMTIPADPIPDSYRYYYAQITGSSYRLCALLEAGGGATSCGNNCNTAGTAACTYEVNNP